MNFKRAFSAIMYNIMEDDDDDEQDEHVLFHVLHKKKRRRICIENYHEVILAYNLSEFKSHFRLQKETVGQVLENLGTEIHHATSFGGRPTNVEKQLLVTIWILANQEVYRSVADRFDLSVSSTWEYFHRVIKIIVGHVKEYIVWPYDLVKTSEDFKNRYGMPGVIGAIDGSHVPIMAPKYMPNSYLNRKMYHSVVLQGVCNANYIFIDCYTGCPGSTHDARVFRKSPLYNRVVDKQYHLLGDSAYPCTVNLITPYKDNGYLNRSQQQFNRIHSATRVTIEQTFGLLKGRFRILKKINFTLTEAVPNIIMACCVLHNICMLHNDEIEADDITDDYMDYFEIGNEQEITSSGGTKRDFLRNLLC